MKKLWEKLKSCVMQCSHAARSRWQEWPKRKRVTVCTLASLGVLILGTAIFCLTVPLFYWWPDDVPIPGTNGTMMFVKESDPDRNYCRWPAMLQDDVFPIAVDIYFADEHELEGYVHSYDKYEVDPPVFCMVTVTDERNVDYQLSTGEWLASSVVEAEVVRSIFDVNHELNAGDRILIYTYDRYPMPSVDGETYVVDRSLGQKEHWALELRKTRSIDSFRQWFYDQEPQAITDSARTLRDVFAWLKIPVDISEYLNYPRWLNTRFLVQYDHIDRDYSYMELQQEKWIHEREGDNYDQ